MKYISTRGNIQPIIAEEAILTGLAPDGGLYIPTTFPQLIETERLRELSYASLCAEVLAPFFSRITKAELEEAARQAYARFSSVPPVRIEKRDSFHVLELFHGPTLAFKDVALCLLPHLMELSKKHLGISNKSLLLTATSGDTGKAAMEGFAAMDGFEVIVFYPRGGVSPLQERQMLTQSSMNTTAIGIEGNFDDAQRGVKAMLASDAFHRRLKARGREAASANSINLGRLLAQIVYYVYGAIHSTEMPLRFSVPTGNFGNVLAAYWAGKMGVAMEELLVATNENDVLDVFFKTGHYDARRELILSSTPSMDILLSSNLERLLFEEDEEALKKAMTELERDRHFFWTMKHEGFSSGKVSEKNVREEIRKVWLEEGILLDPHTAVASALLRERKKKGIIVATASPFKFPRVVLESLGERIGNDPFEELEILSERTGLPVPASLKVLADAPITQNRVCMPDQMERAIWEVLDV